MLYYIILIPRPTLTFGKKTKNTDRQISSPYKPILLPYVAIIITIVYVLVTFLYYWICFNNYLFLSIYVLCSYLQGGDYGLFFNYFGAYLVARGVILTSLWGSFWSFSKFLFLGRVLCETGGSPGHSSRSWGGPRGPCVDPFGPQKSAKEAKRPPRP